MHNVIDDYYKTRHVIRNDLKNNTLKALSIVNHLKVNKYLLYTFCEGFIVEALTNYEYLKYKPLSKKLLFLICAEE